MKKLYIIILLLIILAGIFFIFTGLNKKYNFLQSNDDAKRIYKQGLADIKNNDLQNAYFNFSKISQYNDLYETALFHQGLIASELKDNDSAIVAYETLLEKFPNTFFKERSIYNLAIAYFNNNLHQQAYANFKLITKKYSSSDYADAANYFLGMLIKEEDEQKAIEHFINYIKIAPTGKYALPSINELISLSDKFSSEQNLAIGMALLENEKYSEALNYLNMSKMDDSWAPISIAYKYTKNYKLSKQIFEDGLSQYSKNDSEIQQKAINEYANLYNKNEIGLKAAKTLCDNSNCKLNDYIMFNLIPYIDKNTKFEYYNRIYNEFPDGRYAADALYNSMFNDYVMESYDNAIIKAKKYISKYSNKKSAAASMYWLAKAYEKKKNNQEANNYFNKVLTKYPDSYYAYLTAMKLNKKNPYEINSKVKISTKPIYIDFPILHANLPINSSKKINELITLGDFKIFEYADFDNEIIKSWVAYYEGDLTKASVIAEKILSEMNVKPTYDDDIYKLVYPIGYANLINETSENSEISPYLLLSLIRKESRFDKNAISAVGAIGLTQLMPDTANYIANLSNIRYDKDLLFKAEYNIKLGVRYYDYIKRNHQSNDLFALASYNGGHGAVEKWRAKIQTNDMDEFVERIPYPETKDYIKNIYQNYWVYNCIYNSSKVK